MSNQCMFYIGQEVVAIESDMNEPPVIVKGRVYKIIDIQKSPCCNRYEVMVYSHSTGNYPYIECYCGNHRPYTGKEYYRQELFAPLQNIELGTMTIEDAIEWLEKENKQLQKNELCLQ